MDQVPSYVESVAPRQRRGTQLAAHVALAVLLAMAAFVAVNSGHGTSPKLRLIHPRNGGCAVPFTKSVTDGGSGGGTSPPPATTTLTLCISQEGNITSLFYPDTSAGHSQISFDAYCLQYNYPGGPQRTAVDFGGASGTPPSFGFGPATIAQPNGPDSNPIVVTRRTVDGVFELSEYIKVNFVPRSIAVVVSLTNRDRAGQDFDYVRALAPQVDGDATDDQYKEFGISNAIPGATTGQALQTPSSGTDSLLLSVASNVGTFGPQVFTDPLADWLTGAQGPGPLPCGQGGHPDPPGDVSGGSRVFLARALTSDTLAPGATAKVTFDIRML